MDLWFIDRSDHFMYIDKTSNLTFFLEKFHETLINYFNDDFKIEVLFNVIFPIQYKFSDETTVNIDILKIDINDLVDEYQLVVNKPFRLLKAQSIKAISKKVNKDILDTIVRYL